MSFWSRLSRWGTDGLSSTHEIRYIILCNRASILVAAFTFLLFLIGLIFFGWIYAVRVALGFSIFFLFPLALNKLGFAVASRILFSITVSLASLVVSVIDKFDFRQMEELQYYEFRLTLLSATLFPFILFSVRETKSWVIALLMNFICIVAYDPVHHYFGVGYYDVGFSGPSYFFINYMMMGAFLIIAVSAFFLKSSFEKAEKENEQLIRELSNQKNEVLKINEVLDQKRQLLAQENSKLTENLVEKNNQLMKTNQELVQHNNDLQQFSYTISHNLRGPVASISGLINLLQEDQLGEANMELLPHFKSSFASLDRTIKDLSNIIDVRNGLSRVRETIFIREEIGHILMLLNKEIAEAKIRINVAVEEQLSFVSVKPMVTSILHNLISNAIKYRSPDREAEINVLVTVEGDYARLMVTDNGLGIDLNRHREHVFGIYKRFHSHLDGKGLGLFLVKLQAESLGGHVEVSSAPNQGTTFRVFIRVQEKPE